MEQLRSVEEFREKLRSGNSRHAILTVGVAAMIMIAIDYALKISLVRATLTEMLVFLALVTVYLAARFVYSGLNKLYYIALYVYVHAVVIWGFAHIVAIPSPLLAFVVVISLSVFMELGYKGVIISVITFSTGILVDMEIQGQLPTQLELLRAVAYLLAIAFLVYYSTIFLRIADEELVELDKTAAQINFERSRLSVLVNNLNDAVIGCDEDLTVVLTNPKALHVLNLEDDPTAQNLNDLMYLKDENGNSVTFSQLLNPKKKIVIYTNYRLYYTEKDFINVYIAINNVGLDASNSESGYVILLRDITRQKSLEEERTEFISIMSHELRTPVSIVEGGISLAQSMASGENEKLQRFLDKAHDQTLMLAEIVNSLSTLVHSERENEKIQLVEVDPRVIVKKIADNYSSEAERKGLTLKTEIPDDAPMVYTGQEYLYEILQNLVTNALKYTKTGSITIKVEAVNKTHVAFSVIDTGIGISVADIDHVFDRFWRSEDYRTRESNGTGLGLYITKKLADSLGATITVESKLDKGSAFKLNVPIVGNRDI